MPSRRQFIQTLSVTPWLLPGAVRAAARHGQLALVVGNGAYAHAGLNNPAHDARAMGQLLGQAGFAVEQQVDAGQAAMLDAIERFGKQVQASDTRLAVFYYAGHGAQLDWRNYLLPVDANINSAEAIKSRCIDLGRILDHFTRAQRQGSDKTFVVILDACRDNPFGASYRPQQKGLSQFDAPVGSLLAYATAPGNVAADGEGRNGLYTEHLLREVARPGVRIEDALKRVRLNVRLASGGEQIPWESTSLETDVFLFPDPALQVTEEELERRFAEELAHWNRIRTSRRAEDWSDYLRLYPSGRFSELAQTRLNRALKAAERRKAESLPLTIPAPTPAVELAEIVASEPQPAEDGVYLPPVTQVVSTNPYSAGRFPLGRKFTLGDTVVLRDSDLLTGVEEGVRRMKVTRVDEDNDRVELNGGKFILDIMGNVLETPQTVADVPQQFFPAELQVGQQWRVRYSLRFKTGRNAGQTSEAELKARILARESVRSPAGEFSAFRIEAWGFARGGRASVEIALKFWVVPGVNFPVRRERVKKVNGRLKEATVTELIAIRQAVTGLVV